MGYVLDQSFRPERYFEEICKYPHGSYQEKPLSDYLVQFAVEHNLKHKQYENFNVIIYKDASPGYEDHAPLMMQAHIDMVCEKDEGIDHNFEKDPISIYVEDGLLKARGTTLGADDGVGVAYMLAILDDDTVPHPPLECVFTVQEESGCDGARELAFEDLTAKRLIGLDDMGGNTCYVSSCGSQRVIAEKKVQKEALDAPYYLLRVDGLEGGHSAPCISEEKGNAIKLMSRILYNLAKENEIRIAAVNGGSKDNAIPILCEAVFASSEPVEKLSAVVDQFGKWLKDEFLFSDPAVCVTLVPCDAQPVLSAKDSDDLVKYLFMLPNGFRHKSMKIEGLTTASENLATIRMNEDSIVLRYFARAELDSNLFELCDEVIVMSELFGYGTTITGYSPGWQYKEYSAIRETLFAAYRDVTGRELTPIAVHGGLEHGYISAGIPGIDIATCGPLCEDYHTTRENLNLESFREIYEVIKELLKRS